MLNSIAVDHRRVFADEMKRRIDEMGEALFTYVNSTDVHVVADVEDLEKALKALFDAYLAAGKVVDVAVEEVVRIIGNHSTVRGSWSAYRPKPLFVGTLKEIAEMEATIARFDAEAEGVREVARKSKEAQDSIRDEIFKIMPKYVWIRHGNLYFGIDTGTWGGHTISLHVRKPGEELFVLQHRTYYD